MKARPALPRWVRTVVAAGSILVLAACSASPAQPDPGPQTPLSGSTARPLLPIPAVRPTGFASAPPGMGLARYADQAIDWRPCTARLSCATVLAPLDYAEPDGTAITLALAKVPATVTPKLGTLFVNPGGPGGSGIGLLRSFGTTGLEAYDVVGWDPRGVGGSTPVRCFGAQDLDAFNSLDVSPDDGAEEQALLVADRQFGVSCLERSGELLEHISTAETVHDLDLLRSVVGADTISYLGFSYGTLIGSLYAQEYPKRVDRMVLDGAVDLSAEQTVPQVAGFERALTNFAGWCASQRCGLGDSGQQVLRRVTELLQRLDQDPLRVGRRELTQQQGVQGVFTALYGGTQAWGPLGQALVAAGRGNGDPLLRLADQGNSRSSTGAYGQLAYAFPAIRCLDSSEVSVVKAERTAAAESVAAPILGPLGGPDLLCTQWPVNPTVPLEPITAPDAPPIVVVGTTGDPATPYEWAVGMSRQLVSGTLITFDGQGHTAYDQSPCVQALVQDYLVRGVEPPTNARC